MIFKKLINIPDEKRKQYARKTLMIHTVVYLITTMVGVLSFLPKRTTFFEFDPTFMFLMTMAVFYFTLQMAGLVTSIQALKKERPWAWIAAIVASLLSLSILTLPFAIITIYLLIPSEYTAGFEKEMVSLFSNKKEQATPPIPLTNEKTD